MKRLLSLLVVIAMVVSLIPNVFAAKEEIDMDELLGRLVVLEDISLIEVKLDEGSDGKIYQWTPAADEEATELNLSWYPETAVLNVTATTGETTVSATTAEGFGELTLPIVAGQLVEIEVSEANGAAAEGYIYGALSGYPAGHESNPIMLGMVMEATIEKASWFAIKNFVGDLIITGEGAFNVIYEAETFAAVDGVVTLSVNAPMFAGAAMFQIDAAGAYTFSLSYPIGSMENPAQLVIGENVADIKAGSQGYMYTWIATEEGTLKITMPEGGWSYQLNNLTSYAYGDTQWSDSDPVANPAEIAVAAGDEIQLIVNTYDPASPWEAPAGQLTIKAELVLPEPPAPALTITKQPANTLVDLNVAGLMTVEVEGEVKSYKWEISSDGGLTWKNTSITGYNTNTLQVPGSKARHNAMFRCVITSATGETVTSEPATHQVAFLEVAPANAKVATNENAVFTAKWSVPGATYKWQYRNADNATIEWKDATSSIASGRLTDTITVVAKSNRNLFNFRCVISYNGQEIVTHADNEIGAKLLISEDPAEITGQSGSLVVVSGAQAVFTVEAQGTGVTYQWQAKRPDGASWFNTGLSGYNTNTLTVRAYDARSGYQYKCMIMTPNGSYQNKVYSEPVLLTVEPAAAISEQPQNVTAAAGEKAVFHVEATGEGLTYQWQVSTNGGKTFKNLNSGVGVQTATLEVDAVAARDGYYYRCVVMNKYYSSGAGYGKVNTEKAKLTVQ